MTYDYQQTAFSKAVTGGAFAGIFATLANLAYDYFYRQALMFTPSEIINVSSIIFGTMILFTIAGLVYFALDRFVKFGSVIYIVLFVALFIIIMLASLSVQRSDNALENEQFRGLLLGVEGISGAMLAFFIPYLVKHSSIYC